MVLMQSEQTRGCLDEPGGDVSTVALDIEREELSVMKIDVRINEIAALLPLLLVDMMFGTR